MNPTNYFRLSLMMFLQFFVWGAWYVTMSTYLGTVLKASGIQIGAAYSAMSIATIISPIFIGLIADRYFAAQKLFGILHLGGAAILYFITRVGDPGTFYWVLLLYSLLYAPTLALANSIAFYQMSEPGKQFPGIRVWGTIGWIVTGWAIDKVLRLQPEQFGKTFEMAAIASLILGLLSFTLPNTPPKAKDEQVSLGQLLGKDALVLFSNRSFVLFFIASILICIPLSFYYSFTNKFLVETGMPNATSNMTFGQISEALFILAIPFLFKKWGVKWMILIGMIAWAVRFLLFGFGDAGPNLWMLFAGIILHGVCYDFFFVTGQIYTDLKAGERIKSSAQGLITMATYGIGMFIGTLFSGYISDAYTLDGVTNWKAVWMVPAGIAFIVLIAFALFFKDDVKKQTS